MAQTAWESLPTHVLVEVFKHADLPDLLSASLVCKQWYLAANADEVWETMAHRRWASKSYVRYAPTAVEWKEKLKSSLEDSGRTNLTKNELLSFEWLFRLKVTAPKILRLLDPWHLSTADPPPWSPLAEVVRPPLLRRQFRPNGTICNNSGDSLGRYYERWQFVGGPVASDSVLLNGNYLATVARTPDWGWTMEVDDAIYIANLPINGPLRLPPNAQVPQI